MKGTCALIHAKLHRDCMPEEYYETKEPIKCLQCENWFEMSLQFCKQEKTCVHGKSETVYTVFCPYCSQEHRLAVNISPAYTES